MVSRCRLFGRGCRVLARRKSREEIEASKRFRQAVLAANPVCVGKRMDPDHVCDGDHHAHHVIPKQSLRNRFWVDLTPVELFAVMYDQRNGERACDKIHMPLTTKVGRNSHIPWRLLRPETIRFAGEHGIEHMLARECPGGPSFFGNGVQCPMDAGHETKEDQ